MRHHSLIAGVSLLAVAGSASAAFDIPSFRGAPSSDFAAWDSFVDPVGGANLPDDPATTNTNATLTQLTPGAVIASSGNLYSASAVPVYEITDSAPDVITDIVLQIRVAGLEFDASSVIIEYDNGEGLQTLAPVSVSELSRIPFGGFGDQVEWRFDFDLIGLGVTDYTIRGEGDANNISLDRAELDVAFIPSPGGVVTLASLGAFTLRRRRR